ncbi:MAG TPA: hypothetical protein PKD28_00185 [Candidatus Saccharibacteria bacterium]|nr:hypothetical protein [Candidatus Saccharibacteria bacterium]
MTDSSQEDADELCILESALSTGDALNEAANYLKEVLKDIRITHQRIEHLTAYLVGTYYTDEQYRRASAEIVRLDTTVLPALEAQRVAALTMLIDAHYPVSVHYR